MDRGQKDTERIENLIEKRINHEYAVAMREIEDELSSYFARFEKKDETWRRWVANGERTKEEYQQWRIGQMAVGRRWADQKEAIARQLVETSKTSLDYVRKYSSEIWAENFNYATYQVEHMAGINTPFTLWSKESVNRLVEQNPDIAPPVGKKLAAQIAEGKAVKWNKQQLQSVMIQGILQGDSISKLATRLATQVGDKDRKASIRNARTISTGVQSAGRVDAYKRAQEKGVKLQQMWCSVMDNRTRHSHRWLDGEIRPVGDAFSNGCEYPGDPKGDPAEIYNCRCRLRGVVEGLTPLARQYRDTSAVGGMSYDEWRNAKAKSGKVTAPDERSRDAKQRELAKYRNGNNVDYMGKPKNFNMENTKVKAYEVEGMNGIFAQRSNEDALNTASLVDNARAEVSKLNDVSSIVVTNKMSGIAGYDHVNNVLYVNEMLSNADYVAQNLTDYFVADNAIDVLKHEMHHKEHWDSVIKIAKENHKNYDIIKHDLETDLRKYVAEQSSMDFNYITRVVSRNANDAYIKDDNINELVADILLQEDKGIVKDTVLLNLVKGVVK